MKEEHAIILDYLPQGYATSFKKEAVAQAVGEELFSLLELLPRPGVAISLRERVYIGSEKRDKIQVVRGRLLYDQLTTNAKNELPAVVKEIILKNEEKYLAFFNKAGPVSLRQHAFELLPGVGKKHAESLLKAREEKPFASFKDLSERVRLLPDPIRLLAERITMEIKAEAKYNIFVRQPKQA